LIDRRKFIFAFLGGGLILILIDNLIDVFFCIESLKKTFIENQRISVADPGCLSQIPDPEFYPSRIPDPKTVTKERGEKKFVVIPFL
jgi:hypothetical protein